MLAKANYILLSR